MRALVLAGRGPGLHGAGVPDPNSRAAKLGIHNVDPAVTFRALGLMASGKVDVKPLITANYGFEHSIAAFERVAEGRPGDVKTQILMG